jgi:hypothetical protein
MEREIDLPMPIVERTPDAVRAGADEWLATALRPGFEEIQTKRGSER